MKKILLAAVAAISLLAVNAKAEWNVTKAANDVQSKADTFNKKINDAKAKQAEKDAAEKAKQEAKQKEIQDKLEAKKAKLQAKIDAKKAEAAKEQAKRDADAAARQKAIDDAKNSLNNLKSSLSN